jgi:DNA-binding MarR family transcriptional regulator
MQNRKNDIQTFNKAESASYNSCGWYLKILGTWMDGKMHERLEPLGLSLSQFTIIMILLEKDGLTQVDIGRKVMLPAYATTRNINKLESLGYVKRKRHESSRRSYRIVLTEAGSNLAPALYEASESVNNLFLSPVEESQKAEFLRILSMLAAHINVQT